MQRKKFIFLIGLLCAGVIDVFGMHPSTKSLKNHRTLFGWMMSEPLADCLDGMKMIRQRWIAAIDAIEKTGVKEGIRQLTILAKKYHGTANMALVNGQNSALYYANKYICSDNFSVETLDCLASFGASFDGCDADGVSLIHLAICFNESNLLQYLLDKKVCLTNMPDGMTPLMMACCYGFKKVFDVLMAANKMAANKVDLFATDENGRTALHYAAGVGSDDVLISDRLPKRIRIARLAMLKALIDAGVPYNQEDIHHMKPIDYIVDMPLVNSFRDIMLENILHNPEKEQREKAINNDLKQLKKTIEDDEDTEEDESEEEVVSD